MVPLILVFPLVALVLFYMGLAMMIHFRQPTLLYVPDRAVDGTPADINMAYDDVRLRVGEGETIAGWFIPAYGPGEVAGDDGELAGRTVLMCHGNGGDIADRLESIRVFHAWRLNIFIFDYRGYGESSGRPEEHGTYEDARAAWDYLTQAKSIPPDHILLYGRSLGGAVAARLALEVHASCLILESTFTSVPDMAHFMFPMLPTRWLCSSRYDTAELLPRLRCPVLISHGQPDRTVPYAHGRRLYEIANRPKQFVELDGDHDNGLDTDLPYQRQLQQFLLRHFAHLGVG